MGTRPGYSIILILLFNKIIPMNKNYSQSSMHFILHLNLSPGLPQRYVPRSKIKHNTMLGKRLLARYEVHFIFITSTLDWFDAWIRRIPSPLRTFSRMKIEYFISFDPSWSCCCWLYYYDLHFIGLRFTQSVNAFTMESNPGPGQPRNCCPSLFG